MISTIKSIAAPLLTIATLICAPIASASVTYNYQGNSFGIYTSTSSTPIGTGVITGSITLSQALAPNMSFAAVTGSSPHGNVTPTTFSFSNGYTTGSLAPAPGITFGQEVFEFTTDATGMITGWQVLLRGAGSGGTGFSIDTFTADPNGLIDGLQTSTADGTQLSHRTSTGSSIIDYHGGIANSPGIWTLAGPISSVPEPQPFVLFGIGLVALGYVRRQRV